MAGKALSLIDLFNLYKKNLKAGIYFLILAIISSVFFFFFNNAYLKGEYDYEVKINIKSPLLNLNMVNILGINRLVINEDSSVSYSSVNENIREYYVIVEEYMKLAHNEALKYNDFFSYNTDITNYKNVLLTIQFKSVKDLNTVSSKVDNFVDVLNSSIGEL